MTFLTPRPGSPDELLAQLTARPVTPTGAPFAPGASRLGFGGERDGLLHVPRAAVTGAAVPLVIGFHATAGEAGDLADLLVPHAERAGVALLLPDSRHRTWDRLVDGWGADVTFVDVALDIVTRRLAIDASRVALAGFAEGANYALSLALANEALVTHVLAFSPGSAILPPRPARPRCFVTHGTEDAVIPVGGASRHLVPQLERLGCEVRYHEFDGGHELPTPLAAEAFAWLVATPRR